MVRKHTSYDLDSSKFIESFKFIYWLIKIRDTKGTFHAKMGTIKDRNGMDITEAEDTKKRWQEYTKELYKTDLHDPDNHDGVITHLDRARHPGMQSQVGLRKHHCEQS